MTYQRGRLYSGTLLLIVILLFPLCTPTAQKPAKEDTFSRYWHQRASLFRLLPDTPGEVIFLGDSITDGGNWSELFQDWRVKNRGISGDTTDGVLARLDEVVSANPAKVFLLIGVNDLASGRTPDYIVNNIKLIIKKIRKASPKTQVYLQSLLPVNPAFRVFPKHVNKTKKIKVINQRLQKYARRVGLEFIDLFNPMATPEGYLNPDYTNDGLHLTGEGYLAWKSIIEAKVKE